MNNIISNISKSIINLYIYVNFELKVNLKIEKNYKKKLQ